MCSPQSRLRRRGGDVSGIYGQATHLGEGVLLAATRADRLGQAGLASWGVRSHDFYRGVLWIDNNRGEPFRGPLT